MVPPECSISNFGKISKAPPDPILSITNDFNLDNFASKVNLGVGAYRSLDNKPYVLKVVRMVERILASDPDTHHDYLPQDGMPSFNQLAAQLLFGKDSQALRRNHAVTVQTISGTGALFLGLKFLRNSLGQRDVWISNPSWPVHKDIVLSAGFFPAREYRYIDKRTFGLDFDGMIHDLSKASRGSIVIFQACAHNPTGVDPTQEQWKKLLYVVKERNLLTMFDSAYQGFASGDLDYDAWAVRLFANNELDMLVAQSFSKNIGLYGERVGSLTVISKGGTKVDAIRSQLKALLRPIYSSPPTHGARITATILENSDKYSMWKEELTFMARRVIMMRQRLYDLLIRNEAPGSWEHIIRQKGMFCFSGLTELQVKLMKDKFHVYMTGDGRMCMAALNNGNIEYVANALKSILTIGL